jgi:hypothetical protein
MRIARIPAKIFFIVASFSFFGCVRPRSASGGAPHALAPILPYRGAQKKFSEFIET